MRLHPAAPPTGPDPPAPRDDTLDGVLSRAQGYAVALTHDQETAADLVQEACLRVSRRGGPWHVGYLFATIRNAYLDTRRRARVVAFVRLDGSHDTVSASGKDPLGASLDPALARALATLNPLEREALFLTVVEGYSTDETCRLTGAPRGTILSRVHRAKAKLRQALGGSSREEK